MEGSEYEPDWINDTAKESIEEVKANQSMTKSLDWTASRELREALDSSQGSKDHTMKPCPNWFEIKECCEVSFNLIYVHN